MIFSVWPDPFLPDRWLVARHAPHARLYTAVSSHLDEGSAKREAARLQREHDDAANKVPPRPHQMVLGFYSDEQP